MGGKALSANVAIRLTKANYERLASECVAKLRAAYPGMRIEVLGNYLDVLQGLHQIGRRGFFCMAMWTKIKFTL